VAVFAPWGRQHLAAEVMDDEMEAVADTENRGAEFEKLWIGRWGVGVINGRGAAGEDDAERLMLLNFGEGDGAGQDYGEDVELANAAGDELGVLRAKIEDDDCLGVHVLVWQGARRDVKNGFGGLFVMITSLEKVDAPGGDAINETMLLGDAAAPAAGKFEPKRLRLADARKWVDQDGLYEFHRS